MRTLRLCPPVIVLKSLKSRNDQILTDLLEDAVANRGFEACGLDCQARVRPEGEGNVASEVSIGGVEVMFAENWEPTARSDA